MHVTLPDISDLLRKNTYKFDVRVLNIYDLMKGPILLLYDERLHSVT